MTITLPFLTSYDPPGSSEGSLDPLGLYQIADQLAVQLVPAVRERMQRIRFLTAMAVGTLVTEGLEDDPRNRDASPYLVWEWLITEAFVRSKIDEMSTRGAPGTLVAKRAVDQHNYLDARSYLKNPRIFGFNGVYKRLAIQLGIVNVHLGPGPHAEGLIDAWAHSLQSGNGEGAKQLIARWSTAVRRSLEEKPPRTKSNWGIDQWVVLADAFAPSKGKAREKRYLRDLLLAKEVQRLGSLPLVWELQEQFGDAEFREESLHDLLEEREPAYGSLLKAIRAYEGFARSLQDAFDVLKTAAAARDAQGFAIPAIGLNDDFKRSVKGLHERFESAHAALGNVSPLGTALQNLFSERFRRFSDPMDTGTCALAICDHHEDIQRGKSADGKRPWFDRLGRDRIYIRHAYRKPLDQIKPDRYVHEYRGWPIRRFYQDLS
jgi:hypothetical protein